MSVNTRKKRKLVLIPIFLRLLLTLVFMFNYILRGCLLIFDIFGINSSTFLAVERLKNVNVLIIIVDLLIRRRLVMMMLLLRLVQSTGIPRVHRSKVCGLISLSLRSYLMTKKAKNVFFVPPWWIHTLNPLGLCQLVESTYTSTRLLAHCQKVYSTCMPSH